MKDLNVVVLALLGGLLGACQARSPSGALPPRDASQSANQTTGSSSGGAVARRQSHRNNAPQSANGSATENAYDDNGDVVGDEPEDAQDGESVSGSGFDTGDDTDRPNNGAVDDPRINRTIHHPYDGMAQTELERLLKEKPESLGSVSLGRPNAGGLFNAVRMPDDPAWKLVDPSHAYGTEETVLSLGLALHAVFEHFPSTEAVSIGHISARSGGHLNPHRSHQSGRDVDVGFYYKGIPNQWYARATPDNLDLERTTFLVRSLVDKTDIEMILIDHSLQAPLEQTLLEQGYNADWTERVFHGGHGRPPIVRHAPGHATHLHLRFRNPIAQQSGQRLASLLVQHHLAVVPPKTLTHVARAGDTLAKLAARYGTTMHEIRIRNGMRDTSLVAGHIYTIPTSATSSGSNSKNLPLSSAKAGSPVRK